MECNEWISFSIYQDTLQIYGQTSVAYIKSQQNTSSTICDQLALGAKSYARGKAAWAFRTTKTFTECHLRMCRTFLKTIWK